MYVTVSTELLSSDALITLYTNCASHFCFAPACTSKVSQTCGELCQVLAGFERLARCVLCTLLACVLARMDVAPM